MNFLRFKDILLLSNLEILNLINNIELKLFNLRLKKITYQSFNSHEIKYMKRKLAQLKTLLTIKLKKKYY